MFNFLVVVDTVCIGSSEAPRGARRTAASTRVDTAPAMAEAAAWEMNGENRRSDTEGMGNKNLVALKGQYNFRWHRRERYKF